MTRVILFLTLSLPAYSWAKGDVSAPQKMSPTQSRPGDSMPTKPAPQADKHSLPLALKK